MKQNERKHSPIKLENADIHGITSPDGGENAPVILVITESSLVSATIKDYLMDHGYRIAGPYSSHDGASAFIRRYTPNLLIFDGMNNSTEEQLLNETMTREISQVPLIILGNSNLEIKANIVSHLKLPIEHQELGEKIRELLPYETITPTEQLIKFVNQLFLKIIQMGPEEHRRTIEDKINSTIFEFCSRNSDFTKQSGESSSIIFTSKNRVSVKDVIKQLVYQLEVMITEIDETCQATWAKALVVDSIESLLIRSPGSSPHIWDFAEAMGVKTREFQQTISRMIPKLQESEKAVFVAYFSHDDDGPEIIMHVTNDPKISQGLDHGLAARIMTIVGQGTSYHEGVYGPIPVPTAKNICAVIWSKVLDSDIQDNRMNGQSLCVVAIGFYSNLLSHLPTIHNLRTVFDCLIGLKHVNDISDMHLELIEKSFLDILN